MDDDQVRIYTKNRPLGRIEQENTFPQKIKPLESKKRLSDLIKATPEKGMETYAITVYPPALKRLLIEMHCANSAMKDFIFGMIKNQCFPGIYRFLSPNLKYAFVCHNLSYGIQNQPPHPRKLHVCL
jgi:hypothetical protein